MSRVLLFAHRLSLPGATGVVRYANELAFAIDRDPSLPADYILSSTPEPHPLPWEPRRLRVVRARGPRRLVHLSWSLWGRPPVERLTGGADLVHALDPSVPVPTRVPLVATIHDLMPVQFPHWFAPGPRWAFSRAVKHIRDCAAVIITDSQQVANDVVEVLGVEPERVRPIPPGVSERFSRDVPATETEAVCRRYGVSTGAYLLFVGTVSTRKNLGSVLRALPAAGRPTLLIAGPPGRGAEAVKAEVERLGLQDVVRFAGFVPDDGLAPLMAGARALVHPATYEGFGFTPLEAMAAGTPVAVSRAGSLPEIVGDAGLLVDAEDEAAWAAAIRELLHDAESRAGLVARGRARAARFQWGATAAAVAALHQEVLARPS